MGDALDEMNYANMYDVEYKKPGSGMTAKLRVNARDEKHAEDILKKKHKVGKDQITKMQKEEVIVKEVEVQEKPEKEEAKDVIIKDENKFVSLINVAKIKGELYKSYLDEITAINSDIKLCRDELNRIEIYYGPFENNTMRIYVTRKP